MSCVTTVALPSTADADAVDSHTSYWFHTSSIYKFYILQQYILLDETMMGRLYQVEAILAVGSYGSHNPALHYTYTDKAGLYIAWLLFSIVMLTLCTLVATVSSRNT